jgi:hypothetical protein
LEFFWKFLAEEENGQTFICMAETEVLTIVEFHKKEILEDIGTAREHSLKGKVQNG